MNIRLQISKTHKAKPAQVMIETTVALLLLLVLFLGSTKIFVWICKSIADQNVAWEATRTIKSSRGGNVYSGPEDIQDVNDYEHYNPIKLELVE